jgi:hypothetical protein
MARNPEWFERLDGILDVLRDAESLEVLGRNEVRAIFGCSERDSIRLLHRFGACERNDALVLTRSGLIGELEVVRGGEAYAAFLRRRNAVADELTAARKDVTSRDFSLPDTSSLSHPSLEKLPATLVWRRPSSSGPGKFEITYRDGNDLMLQIAAFLSAASAEREQFFAGTEPADAGR